MIENYIYHIQLFRTAAAVKHRCIVILVQVKQKSGSTGASLERTCFTGDIFSRSVNSPKALVDTGVDFTLEDGVHVLPDLRHIRDTRREAFRGGVGMACWFFIQILRQILRYPFSSRL